MPREIVEIKVSGEPAETAAAHLWSYVAYPGANEKAKRGLYARSLYRTAVMWRATSDPSWGQSLVLVRPSALLEKDKIYLSSLGNGSKKLERHLYTSLTSLLPYLLRDDPTKPIRLHELFSGMQDINSIRNPTIQNITILLARMWGYNEVTSGKTIETRFWAKTKPVAHLGYAIGLWITAYSGDIGDDPIWFFKYFFEPNHVPECIAVAEHARQHLALIKQFTIREAETIQFIAV